MMIDLHGMRADFPQRRTGAKPFLVADIHRQHEVKGPFLHRPGSRNVPHPAERPADPAPCRRRKGSTSFPVSSSTSRMAAAQPSVSPSGFTWLTTAMVCASRISFGNCFRFPAHLGHRCFPPFQGYPPALWRYGRRIRCSCR